MKYIDAEKLKSLIQERKLMDSLYCGDYAKGLRNAYDKILSDINCLLKNDTDMPKWKKLKNIDSYSDWKIWKDDKVLFVADSEGYLYACSIRELFDKLPKEE